MCCVVAWSRVEDNQRLGSVLCIQYIASKWPLLLPAQCPDTHPAQTYTTTWNGDPSVNWIMRYGATDGHTGL